MRLRHRTGGALLAGVLLGLTACTGTAVAPMGDPAPAPSPTPQPVTETTVQLLAFNDLHGRLGVPRGRDGVLVTADGEQLAGGAAHLAGTLAELRADFGGDEQDSLTLAAGDLVGASTFTSAGYRDEPTIEVLDALGLEFSAVGNHEFDRGREEFFRLSGATDGQGSDDVTACEGVERGLDACFLDSTGDRFSGSGFGYLGANVRHAETGAPALPPYAVVPTTGGTEIGVIGVVTEGVPRMLPEQAIEGLAFEDPAVAVNRAVAELRERGIEAIVLLAHEGGWQGDDGRFDTCDGDLAGTPGGRLNAEVDAAVDVIVGGHSHAPYTCALPDPDGNPRPVTQASSYGRSVTDLRLTIGTDGEVDRSTIATTAGPVLRGEPDPEVAAIVDHWESRAAAMGEATAGSLTDTITRAPDPESGVGIVIADAMLAAGRIEGEAPVLAFMNRGNLRADLVPRGAAAGDPGGTVTYRGLYRVMPFDHTVQVVTLSGAALRAALEQQFTIGPEVALSTSSGVTYTYDPARPLGDRVDPCSLMVDGRWIDPAGEYRVALASFLLGGGDGFTAFADATEAVEGPPVLDALAEYLTTHSPLAPPAEGWAVASPERLTC